MRTLGEAIEGADIFLGLSVGGVLKPDMVKRMAKDPLVLALANPAPEILPDEAMAARADAIVATGRSDYPNQVNNVLCFPFIFRGALDVGATEINHEMKVACVEALADLARQEEAEQTAKAYGGKASGFGRDHLIPAPFDPRLISALAPRVADAAMKSGVATRPIEDIEAYSDRLEAFVFQSGLLMQPIFARARRQLMRVTFAEGEDPRVLRAVQAALDDRVCTPILIGRPGVVSRQIEKLGLRFKPGRDCELVDPEDDPRYRDYWTLYHELAQRHGVTPDGAWTASERLSPKAAAWRSRRPPLGTTRMRCAKSPTERPPLTSRTLSSAKPGRRASITTSRASPLTSSRASTATPRVRTSTVGSGASASWTRVSGRRSRSPGRRASGSSSRAAWVRCSSPSSSCARGSKPRDSSIRSANARCPRVRLGSVW